jgi:hypothetical protein
MSGVFQKIFEHVSGLEIIDTHEHLPAFERLREKETDILKEYLIHYLSCDLISAGLPQGDYNKVINHTQPLMERWKLVESYWKAARNTGYARALDLSVKELYGIDRIDGSTIEELNARFLGSLKPGHYRKVLKEKSKIKVSILHDIPKVNDRIVFTSDLKCDKEFFRNAYPIDALVYPQTGEGVRSVGEEAGITITSFDDWLEASETLLDRALETGAVALKSGLAYQRSLHYVRVTKNEAERCFNEVFKTIYAGTYLPQLLSTGKELQDYMMHFLLRLAAKRNLTIQFHTGIQEGNGNYLYHSDPALLTNLFLEYPDVDFDIFHMGFPFQGVVGVLAKNFPNVFIDMCWAHILSPTASIDALAGWIDSVPVNKISAFGGDYLFVDGVYGHQCLARENVSKALARKVEEGVIDLERASEIAGLVFYENPLKIFKLRDTL